MADAEEAQAVVTGTVSDTGASEEGGSRDGSKGITVEPSPTESPAGSESTVADEATALVAPRPYLEPFDDAEAGAEVSGPSSDGVPAGVTRPFIDTLSLDSESPSDHRDRVISLDLTPLSCKSSASAADFHQPDQTVIIFDWDDTLCPSTTCMRRHGLSVMGPLPEEPLKSALDKLAGEVDVLLRRAQELSDKVVIVTNAEEGWVELSCKAWLPSLEETLATCEVASARSAYEHQGVTSPAGWKARAFEEVIDRFYSRYPNQSWKNIISVGDAPHEREALRRVVRGEFAPFNGSKCRSKSVKFVLRPSIENLSQEIQMLLNTLEEIVFVDDDLDLHFSGDA